VEAAAAVIHEEGLCQSPYQPDLPARPEPASHRERTDSRRQTARIDRGEQLAVQHGVDNERTTSMPENEKEPSGAERMFGDFAPGLVHFTDDVLFGDAWKRPQLSPRDRSLITVAALTTGGNAEQLTFHLQFAKDNGVTAEELIEAITHLAFYAGWPKAMSAMAVAKQVLRGN
jgi:4-carboxymuconolactone decarboxylase